MFAGFVGRRYRTGAGIVLLAINPGGGGDAYRSRTGEDEHFYPLLRAFKRATQEHALEAFERVNETFAEIVRCWNVWKIIEPTLEAAGKALDEVAYMNLVPYRTRANKMPPVAARIAAVKRFVEPTIDLLVPRQSSPWGRGQGRYRTSGNRMYPCTVFDALEGTPMSMPTQRRLSPSCGARSLDFRETDVSLVQGAGTWGGIFSFPVRRRIVL